MNLLSLCTCSLTTAKMRTIVMLDPKARQRKRCII